MTYIYYNKFLLFNFLYSLFNNTKNNKVVPNTTIGAINSYIFNTLIYLAILPIKFTNIKWIIYMPNILSRLMQLDYLFCSLFFSEKYAAIQKTVLAKKVIDI